MKIARKTICGKERVLCFSTRVMLDCIDRFGSIENIFGNTEEDAGNSFRSVVWLVAQLSKAGAKYAELTGMDAAEPITEDDLLDLCGKDDFAELKEAIVAAIMAGSDRDVEVAGKNGETTHRT